MTTVDDNTKIGNFMSTMLISKMHKKENYKLTQNLDYTLKHPTISKVPQSVISYAMIGINLLTGILLVVLLELLKVNDLILTFLALIAGYIAMNQIQKKYFNKPKSSVSELNTFVIASKPITNGSVSLYQSPQQRVDLENKIKLLHDSYKRQVFDIIKSEVSHDYELKYSLKVLRSAGSKISVDFDKESEAELFDWVANSLENMYKGTRISYWDTGDGKYRIVVSNLDQQREFVEINRDISDIIDELNLLIFSNHYKEVMDPLFKDILTLVEPLTDKSFYENCTSSSDNQDERFSELLRVLLSKSLGMQEVLKTTKRQFARLNEAKSDLEVESKDINSPELDKLIHQFSINGSMQDLLNNLDSLITSLSTISQNLRSMDINSISLCSANTFQAVSDLYFALEKLRFISTWFEDIASYTNISGGSIADMDSSEADAIPSDVMLRVKDVYKTFSTRGGTVYAVRGVSFDVKEGEFIGLFGPSGSGKTTLLNMMAGLDMPDDGSIYVDGVSLKSLSNGKLTSLRRDKMGFVFQFYNLIPVLKNRENVSYPAEIGPSSNAKKSSSLLDAVQLKTFENQYPTKLSGGQMQRVTIARSLINTPKILFADEPTGDLDSVTGKEIMDLLAKFNKENNTTVILVTHDKSLLSYCTRVIYMTDGQLIS